MLEGELPGYFFYKRKLHYKPSKRLTITIKKKKKKSHGLQPQKAAQQQFEEFVCKKKKKKIKVSFSEMVNVNPPQCFFH